VPKERRGAAGNTNFLGVDVGMLIGPSIAGFIITGVQKTTGDELLGYRVMYRAMVLPVVAAVVLFMLNRKKLLTRIKALSGG
jgi:MFS family permease